MRFITPLLFLVFATASFAQQITVSGYVSDALNGERLISATVQDLTTGRGTTTNTYGFFSLSIDAQSSVRASFVGYQPIVFQSATRRDTLIQFRLDAAQLSEVVIQDDKEQLIESSKASSIVVPVNQIKTIPAFYGEVDVLRSLQLLPGVQGTTEGMSNFIVRGGGPDQNYLLLDGAPVYNASHLYGFFSTFNSDAINHVELYKGAFPARYGGRTSSIVDIAMKEGNLKHHQFQASVGVISAKFVAEGPLKKDRSSFLISGRRSYLNLLDTKITSRMGNGLTDGYYFYDINAKVNYLLSEKDRLYASVYKGGDFAEQNIQDIAFDTLYTKKTQYERKEHETLSWGNQLASLRWNHVFGPKLFLNTTAIYTSYRMEIENNIDDLKTDLVTGLKDDNYFLYRYTSGIVDVGTKFDFDWAVNSLHHIQFGSHITYHDFRPGIVATFSKTDKPDASTPATETPVNANELATYIEDEWSISPQLKVNAGVHAVLYALQGKTYRSVQPRFSTSYSLPGKWTLTGSFSSMQQFAHLLSNPGVGLPTDLWVPSTRMIKPQLGDQFTLGTSKRFKKDIEVSWEGFYKTFSNLIEYKDGASYLSEDKNWQNKVDIGEGRAYGMELFGRGSWGPLNGWVSYTLSKSERRANEINGGAWYPYRFDRRHDAKLTLSYAPFPRIRFNASYVYSTGIAVTLPLEAYNLPTSNKNVYYRIAFAESRNNFRLNDYSRLDVASTYTLSFRGTEHSFTASLFNALDRKNPFYIRVVAGSGYSSLKQVNLFRIIPSISYHIKF